MGRNRDVSVERLEGRHDLLASFDTVRRRFEFGDSSRKIDTFRARAMEIITSTRVRDAFDLEKEPKGIGARYGEGSFRHGPHPGRSLLLARRLVEAGVSVVTVGVHGWDTHSHTFLGAA